MLGRNKKETGKATKYTRLFSVVMVVAMILSGFLGIISTDIGSRNASAATASSTPITIPNDGDGSVYKKYLDALAPLAVDSIIKLNDTTVTVTDTDNVTLSGKIVFIPEEGAEWRETVVYPVIQIDMAVGLAGYSYSDKGAPESAYSITTLTGDESIDRDVENGAHWWSGETPAVDLYRDYYGWAKDYGLSLNPHTYVVKIWEKFKIDKPEGGWRSGVSYTKDFNFTISVDADYPRMAFGIKVWEENGEAGDLVSKVLSVLGIADSVGSAVIGGAKAAVKEIIMNGIQWGIGKAAGPLEQKAFFRMPEVYFEDDFESGSYSDKWIVLPAASSDGISIVTRSDGKWLQLYDDNGIYPEVQPKTSGYWKDYTLSLDVIPYIGKDFWDEDKSELAEDNWITFCNSPESTGVGYILSLTSAYIEKGVADDYLGVFLIKAKDTDGNGVYDVHETLKAVWLKGAVDSSNPLYKYRNNIPLNVKVGVQIKDDAVDMNIYIDGALALSYTDFKDYGNPISTGGVCSIGVYYSGKEETSSVEWRYDNVVVTKGCLFNDQFEDADFSENAWYVNSAEQDYFVVDNGVLNQDAATAGRTLHSKINRTFPSKVVIQADMKFVGDTEKEMMGFDILTGDGSFLIRPTLRYHYNYDAESYLHVLYYDGGKYTSKDVYFPDYYFKPGTWHTMKVVLGTKPTRETYIYVDGKYAAHVTAYNDTKYDTNVSLYTSYGYAQYDNVYIENCSKDYKPPTVSIKSPTEGDTVTGTITVKADVSDPAHTSGIKYTELYLNDTLVGINDTTGDGTKTFQLDTSIVPEGGEYTLTAVAYDNANNSNWDEITVNVINTMFEDNFNSGTCDKWEKHGAEIMEVRNKRLYIEEQNAGGGAGAVKEVNLAKGFIYQADMEIDKSATGYGFGLSFNIHELTGDPDYKWAGYTFCLFPELDLVGIAYYKENTSAWTGQWMKDGATGGTTNYLYPFSVDVGQVYTLKVEKDGMVTKCYVDGTKVIETNIADYAVPQYLDGKIGLMVEPDSLPVSAYFDNVKLWDPYDFESGVPAGWTLSGLWHTTSYRSSTPGESHALSFDGVDDYVSVPDSSSLCLKDEFTIEAWVNLADNGWYQKGIVDKISIGEQDYGYSLIIRHEGTVRSLVGGGSSGWSRATGTTVLSTGFWYHIVSTWKSGGPHRVYVNGVLEGETTSSSFDISNIDRDLYIGQDYFGSKLNGIIDEVRILNRALNATEIQEDYNLKAPYPARYGAVAWYHTDENNGTVLYDASDHGNTGTLINGPTWTSGVGGRGISLAYNREDTHTYNTGSANSGTAIFDLNLQGLWEPHMSFNSWYQTEDSTYWDYKKVFVSTDGGSSWTQVCQVSGTMNTWVKYDVDLSAYAGQSIKVKFEFNTRDSCCNDYEGWYIDDIVIYDAVKEIVKNRGFESAGGWSTEATGGDYAPTISQGLRMWFSQTSVYYYDGDAAQSGAISDSEETHIQTTVNGPETLTFYWKVSSEANYDFLRFYIDGAQQAAISGEVDWQQKSFSIASGTHTLMWKYTKDYSVSSGSDCGWLDKVTFDGTAVGGNHVPSLGYAVDNTALVWNTGDAHNGIYCAYMKNNLGSYGTPRAGYIKQTVTLPSTATTLSYYVKYWKDTWGPGMGVRLKAENGTVLLQNNEGTGGTSSSSGWVQRTFNVSAYAGQTITIEIYLEDLSTTYAGYGDHGGWIAVDDFGVS